MTKNPLFFIHASEYDRLAEMTHHQEAYARPDVSVTRYIDWFLNCVALNGPITVIQKNETPQRVRALLTNEQSVFVSIFEKLLSPPFDEIPRRSLTLALGSYFTPKNFRYCNLLGKAEMCCVSTAHQAACMRSLLGGRSPHFTVFPPLLDTSYFVSPTPEERIAARRVLSIKENSVHIIYAGRVLETKGIIQLIRCLHLWPFKDCTVTIVGNVEEQYRAPYASSRHTHFRPFLEETIKYCDNVTVRLLPFMPKEQLRQFFWSADLFCNFSIHPDENFGITPREAALCGVPIVTTTFGGLHELAQAYPWRGIDTYPTVYGSRFSLQYARRLIDQAYKNGVSCASAVRDRFLALHKPHTDKRKLGSAVMDLLSEAPSVPDMSLITQRYLDRELLKQVHPQLVKVLSRGDTGLDHLMRDTERQPHNRLFPLIQSIYSQRRSPPRVKKKEMYRGFFRLEIGTHERCLWEYAYPGPRCYRFSPKEWTLFEPTICYNTPVFSPQTDEQCLFLQQLVDTGVIVNDMQESVERGDDYDTKKTF